MGDPHTGQHYDQNLADNFYFYVEAGIGRPATVLHGVGGASRARQIAAMLDQLDELFAARRPAAVIVQGDTNCTNAGAQAASYHGIPLVHVEAGLRSYDRAMPEELNRLLVGTLADLHCAATMNNVQNLHAEGVPIERIALTGNTIVQTVDDALNRVVPTQRRPGWRFVLATIHRPENTDDPERLTAILNELAGLGLPVMFPAHPRTVAALAEHYLDRVAAPLDVMGSVGHAEFLTLARQAALLISDSGGVQEECTVLKKPLLVVRNSTERRESIDAGFAHLVQPGPDIGRLARRLLADAELPRTLQRTPSPYGDAGAAHRIAQEVLALADVAARGRTLAPSLA